MSYESSKGYHGEDAVRRFYLTSDLTCARPRTTSHSDTDIGDLIGPPWVTSVKNHREIRLSVWVDELAAMVDRSPWDTGIVVHHRRGKGRAEDWYVTTTLGLALPLLRTFHTCH